MPETSSVAFNPEEFGFFLRKDAIYPPEVKYYEKDHDSIDQSVEKDWTRLNLYISLDGNFANIWYGVVEEVFAEVEYEKKIPVPFKEYYHEEKLFRGYIENKEVGMIILQAIEYEKCFPQYLGE